MKRTTRRFTIVVLSAVLAATAGCVNDELVTEDTQPGERARLDYPQTMGFRILEPPALSREQLQRFDIVHGLRGGATREQVGDAVLIEHWNLGKALRPTSRKGARWARLAVPDYPGHWLLFNGATLTGDLEAVPGVVQVQVEDNRVFSAANVLKGVDYGPDDVMIYALDERGRPDWSQTEQAIVESVDPGRNRIVLKRGQYGTAPRAFRAGRAVVAAHAVYEPTFRGRAENMWWLNFSPGGPRDDVGRTAPERTADIYAQSLLDSPADGVEFDVGFWHCGRQAPANVPTANERRGIDIDNDLRRDDGYGVVPGLGTVDLCGLGSVQFTRRLRDRLGAGFIIQGEGEWRGWPWANGIEVESFPVFAGAPLWRAGERFQHLRFASSRAGFEPRMSYVQVKTPTDTWQFEEARRNRNKQADGFFRWGFAAAMMADGIIAYTMGPGGFGRFTWWDEYTGGRLEQRHYLGQPLGPATFLDGLVDAASRIEGNPRITTADGYEASLASGNDVIRVTIEDMPAGDLQPWGVRLVVPLAGAPSGQPQTLRAKVRADPGYSRLDPALSPTSRKLHARIEGASAVTFHADTNWWDLVITLPPANRPTRASQLAIGMGMEPGWVEIRDLSVHTGDAYAMWRRFEGGIVLMNGTPDPVRFDLARIDPARSYRRLAGVITPQTNTGDAVDVITLPAHDGIVLIVR